MIANALRLEVERYAIDVRQSNPLFTRALAGALRPGHVAAYLENIRYLVSHTPRHLARARDRARALGDEGLAAHYEARRLEEDGHDAWAEQDLEQLGALAAAPASGAVVASMVDLVAYNASRIDADPTVYLAYILLAEYLTVIIGPDWLRLLEQHCGIKPSAMSVVANHVELDRGHVEQALDQIDDLVADPRKLAPMRETLRASISLFERFCAEVTQDETAFRGAAKQASAA